MSINPKIKEIILEAFNKKPRVTLTEFLNHAGLSRQNFEDLRQEFKWEHPEKFKKLYKSKKSNIKTIRERVYEYLDDITSPIHYPPLPIPKRSQIHKYLNINGIKCTVETVGNYRLEWLENNNYTIIPTTHIRTRREMIENGV